MDEPAMPKDAEFEKLIAEAQKLSGSGAYGPSLDAAQRAVARARELASVGLELRAVGIEASTLSLMSRMPEARERLDWVLSVASEKHESPELADTRVVYAVVSSLLTWVEITGWIGSTPVARRFEVLDQAQALLEGIGKPEWRSGVLSMRATILRSLSRPDEAIALGAEAIRCYVAGSPGSTLASYRQRHADGLFAMAMERLDAAEVQYRQILTEGGASVRDEKSANVGLARCALRRGDIAEARRRAERAVQIAGPLGDSAMCGALEVLTSVLRAAGELDHASAVADQLVERARRTGVASRLFYAFRCQIDLSFERADHEGARAWMEEAAGVAASLDDAEGGDRYSRQIRARKSRLDKAQR